MKTHKLTIFAIGNRARGDDGVGPALMDFICRRFDLNDEQPQCNFIQIQECYQLQPEHCYDMENSEVTLFIDATHSFQRGIRVSTVTVTPDLAFTSHSLSPSQLLGIYQRLFARAAPLSFLLEVGANRFELGESICDATVDNMKQAQNLLTDLFAASNKRVALERLSCMNSL